MRNKKWIALVIVGILIPITVVLGEVIFIDRGPIVISVVITILALILFFLSFEQRKMNTRYLVVIASLVALTVVGRFLFVAFPSFKPVTAIIVISAIYFGAEAGFLIGALAALISNIYFGQGPWTPFQMLSWGMIGFIAGQSFIRHHLKNSLLLLTLYGIFAGVLFSLIMDMFTVLSMDGTFHLKRYVTFVSLSFPFMVTYAVSNVVFLLLTMKPLGFILERLKTKYGL